MLDLPTIIPNPSPLTTEQIAQPGGMQLLEKFYAARMVRRIALDDLEMVELRADHQDDDGFGLKSDNNELALGHDKKHKLAGDFREFADDTLSHGGPKMGLASAAVLAFDTAAHSIIVPAEVLLPGIKPLVDKFILEGSVFTGRLASVMDKFLNGPMQPSSQGDREPSGSQSKPEVH